MTPPLLLLGLYAGLLAFALALASWVGHASPADEDTRRISDAAERAALGHLIAPARTMLGTLIALGILLGAYGYFTKGPYMWAALSPIAISLLLSAALYYCARKVLKASSQQPQRAGVDASLVLSSRTSLGVVLCCEASSGIIVLGLYFLAIQELSHHDAMKVVAAALLGLNLSLLLFARSLTSAQVSADASLEDGRVPHPASLARLVGDAFHAPSQRLFTLISLSSFGHFALLFALGNDNGATELSSLWVFPHLLKLIGLLALIFSALVVRSSEDDQSAAGWFRGAIVFLVLGVAGAWALSSELPTSWARSVPAGITFLFLIIAALVAVPSNAFRVSRDSAAGLLTAATRNVFPLLGFAALLIILVTVAPSGSSDQPLPADGLLRLLVGGLLAVAPLALTWQLAREIEAGAMQARQLTQSPEVSRVALPSPSPAMVQLFPLLCFFALASAWAGSNLAILTVGSRPFMVFFIGAFVGALSLAASLGGALRDSQPSSAPKSQVQATAISLDDTPLDLQAAVEQARLDGARSLTPWLLLSMAPTFLAIGLSSFGDAEAAAGFALGAGLGAILCGAGLEWLLQRDLSSTRRTLGRFAIVLGLVQSIWLFATAVVLR